MKTNPLISLLNRLRQAICPGAIQCPGAQASSPAFKEVRSPGRTIASRGAQPNSPAPLAGRGLGAGLFQGGTQLNSPASLAGRGQGRGQQAGTPAHPDNTTVINFAKYLIPAILLLFFLLSLVACKSPAVITNNTQHQTRDSTRHASIQRIETHDTIILGYYPSAQPKLSNSKLSNCPIVRISDRKITIHDTVFVSRTDTLLRTQTITQKERYIPPFYRFCTITLATLATFATLAFSIHLLLRYLKIRSPT